MGDFASEKPADAGGGDGLRACVDAELAIDRAGADRTVFGETNSGRERLRGATDLV
jgi:hypothetical protein